MTSDAFRLEPIIGQFIHEAMRMTKSNIWSNQYSLISFASNSHNSENTIDRSRQTMAINMVSSRSNRPFLRKRSIFVINGWISDHFHEFSTLYLGFSICACVFEAYIHSISHSLWLHYNSCRWDTCTQTLFPYFVCLRNCYKYTQ